MRRARHNLEEQVGGLIDHNDRRVRRPATASDLGELERYHLTTAAPVQIRAVRASSETSHRRVA